MSAAIERLHATILAKGSDRERFPRTSKLLSSGEAHIAKKLAEEAVELALGATQRDRVSIISESADLLLSFGRAVVCLRCLAKGGLRGDGETRADAGPRGESAKALGRCRLAYEWGLP